MNSGLLWGPTCLSRAPWEGTSRGDSAPHVCSQHALFGGDFPKPAPDRAQAAAAESRTPGNVPVASRTRCRRSPPTGHPAPPCPWGSAGARQTHHHDRVRPVLDGPKEPQDDHDDMDKGGQDGRPLIAQEVEHLPLQDSDLGAAGAPEGGRASACVSRPTTPPRAGVVLGLPTEISERIQLALKSHLGRVPSAWTGRLQTSTAPHPGFPHPQSGPQTQGRTREAKSCGSGALSAGVGAEAPWSSSQHPPRLLGSHLTARTVAVPALQSCRHGQQRTSRDTQRPPGSSMVFKALLSFCFVSSPHAQRRAHDPGVSSGVLLAEPAGRPGNVMLNPQGRPPSSEGSHRPSRCTRVHTLLRPICGPGPSPGEARPYPEHTQPDPPLPAPSHPCETRHVQQRSEGTGHILERRRQRGDSIPAQSQLSCVGCVGATCRVPEESPSEQALPPGPSRRLGELEP